MFLYLIDVDYRLNGISLLAVKTVGLLLVDAIAVFRVYLIDDETNDDVSLVIFASVSLCLLWQCQCCF